MNPLVTEKKPNPTSHRITRTATTAQRIPPNMIIPPLLIAFIFLIIDELFSVHFEEKSIYLYLSHVSGSKKVLLRCIENLSAATNCCTVSRKEISRIYHLAKEFLCLQMRSYR